MTTANDVLGKFWRLVDVRGSDECWLWQGALTGDGYGSFSPSHTTLRAHRFVLEISTATPIPAGLWALHSCDTPLCVNPTHLRVGTPADNTRDCIERGRHPNSNRTHCRHGHEYDAANTYWHRDGYRKCRTCDRLWHQRKVAA